MKHKKIMTQDDINALQEKHESLTGKHGYTLTTWIYCGRCGEKLNLRSKSETTLGYHRLCSTQGMIEDHIAISIFINANGGMSNDSR